MAKDAPTAPPQEVRPPVFRINVDPVSIPPEFANSLAHTVVEWSRLESGISADLTMMMRYKIVRDLIPEPPRSFKKKLEMWKRSSDALYRTVTEYRDIVAEVVPRAKAAARVRNHLFHGSWPIDQVPQDGVYKVRSFEATKPDGSGRYSVLNVSQPLLDQLLSEILDLAGLVVGLTVTKMWHAHLGLLKPHPANEPADSAHSRPPTEPTP